MSTSIHDIQETINLETTFKELASCDVHTDFNKLLELYERIYTATLHYRSAEQPQFALCTLVQLHDDLGQRYARLEVSGDSPEIELKMKKLKAYAKQCEGQIRIITNLADDVALEALYDLYRFQLSLMKALEQHQIVSAPSYEALEPVMQERAGRKIERSEISRIVTEHPAIIPLNYRPQMLKPIYQQLASGGIGFFGIPDLTNIISEYFNNEIGCEFHSIDYQRNKNRLAHVAAAVFGHGTVDSTRNKHKYSYQSGVSSLIRRLTTGEWDERSWSWGGGRERSSAIKLGPYNIYYAQNNFTDTNELHPGCMQIKILVYSVTDKNSFAWVQSILRDKPRLHQFNESDKIILVGTKIDEEHLREVPKTQLETLAGDHKVAYCEVSNKTGENIPELENVILNQIKILYPFKPVVKKLPVLESKESKGGCSIM